MKASWRDWSLPSRSNPSMVVICLPSCIVNGGYTRAAADRAIASGAADLVAFAALFIANPDLVERFRRNAPFNAPDPSTFHNGGAQGYIDYPTLDRMMAQGD